MRILQTIKLVNFENDSQDKMIAKASKRSRADYLVSPK